MESNRERRRRLAAGTNRDFSGRHVSYRRGDLRRGTDTRKGRPIGATDIVRNSCGCGHAPLLRIVQIIWMSRAVRNLHLQLDYLVRSPTFTETIFMGALRFSEDLEDRRAARHRLRLR